MDEFYKLSRHRTPSPKEAASVNNWVDSLAYCEPSAPSSVNASPAESKARSISSKTRGTSSSTSLGLVGGMVAATGTHHVASDVRKPANIPSLPEQQRQSKDAHCGRELQNPQLQYARAQSRGDFGTGFESYWEEPATPGNPSGYNCSLNDTLNDDSQLRSLSKQSYASKLDFFDDPVQAKLWNVAQAAPGQDGNTLSYSMTGSTSNLFAGLAGSQPARQ